MSDGPLLVIEEGGEVHRLFLDAAVFGRSRSCDLAFDVAGVSRRHCEIVVRTDGALVRDLGSSHGTFVDGRRVHGESPLHVGQIVRLGPRGPQLRVADVRRPPAPQPPVDEPTQAVEDPDATRFVVPPSPPRPVAPPPRTEPAERTARVHPPPAPRPAPPPRVEPAERTVRVTPREVEPEEPPRTVVSAVPRASQVARPPAAPAVPVAPAPGAAGPAAAPGSVTKDLLLGLALGIAAGVVLLVLVDVSPLRAAIGLD